MQSPKYVLYFDMATAKWLSEHSEDVKSYRRKCYAAHKKQGKAAVVRRKRLLTQKVRLYKSSIGCSCGERHPACLHFHHPDDNKEKSISQALQWGWSWERLEIEMKKCVVMCANCHAKLHYEMARTAGLEPATFGFGDRGSTS